MIEAKSAQNSTICSLKPFNFTPIYRLKPSSPKNPSLAKQGVSVLQLPRLSHLKSARRICPAAAIVGETSSHAQSSSSTLEKQKLGVVVKPLERCRLVLKFVWMERSIGLAIDQVIPGHGTIPLSPYYFWPRKGALDELKFLLQNRPWISQKQMHILLNQATDILTLWSQSDGDLEDNFMAALAAAAANAAESKASRAASATSLYFALTDVESSSTCVFPGEMCSFSSKSLLIASGSNSLLGISSSGT